MLFNRARAVDYMQEYGLDVLVATSSVNITYFTDYYCWIDPLFKEFMMVPGASSNLAQAYAVFPLEGEPALVVNPLFAANAEELWVKDLHIFGSAGLDDSLPAGELPESLLRFQELLHAPHGNDTPTDALLSILNQRGLTGARIGLETEGLPPETKDVIERALPGASLKNCSDLIRMVRMVKSAEEIQRLTRSAEINEQAAMESLAMARPGLAVSEMAGHYRALAAQMGADLDHFAFGVRGLGMTTETGYQLAEDDVLYVDYGCIYRYCFSDSGTTLAMGELSPELSRRFAALRACMDAGEEAMRPGAKASAVAGAMVAALHDRGITASFPHGHGVGLEVRDYPVLVPDNGLRVKDDCVDLPSDLTLEADMVLNLEAPLFMPGAGSLHIEQSYVVTPQGSRPLVDQERRQPVVIGQ
ncbi:MAG: aminopeptidase P family protein [Caldilineaceae bacterium SB0675_bin_29]|uniref:Aminopeptidase P family protein n=1 Tax=Caldilineaceae bacterium SB0675_bin_29 TaxID=2605266 RepID=A0A6B1G632_9CHLR|nr:aminopeptidase P family protein [Caldilineaceae bacterium SB0675_bin_29]